jgi:hypothetical protein
MSHLALAIVMLWLCLVPPFPLLALTILHQGMTINWDIHFFEDNSYSFRTTINWALKWSKVLDWESGNLNSGPRSAVASSIILDILLICQRSGGVNVAQDDLSCISTKPFICFPIQTDQGVVVHFLEILSFSLYPCLSLSLSLSLSWV